MKFNRKSVKTSVTISNDKPTSRIWAGFSRKLLKTKEFLRNNSDVFFTNVAKGSVTVCMYRSEKIEKMEKLLVNKHTYKKLGTNSLSNPPLLH